MKDAAFTRRVFLRWLIGLPLLSILPLRLSELKAQASIPSESEGAHSIGESFKGEELDFEIGLWLFKRAALAKLSCKETEKKGRYVAVLQTEILGILGWLVRHRVDTYRATMEEVDEGRRLRGLSFEEDVKAGHTLRRQIHTFDYQRRKWVAERRKNDGMMEMTVQEIPEGMVYDDFITATYNFRFGVYGTIERGKKYTVATFPRKGVTCYEVTVTSKEEEEKRRKSERSREGKDFFVRLLMDPEMTHSKRGMIEGWLSKELCPMEGAIKEVVLFGDVKGTLIKRTKA